MKRRIVIGITGSIGSGKSSCAKYLSQFGFLVINADKLYRFLYRKGSVLEKKLVSAFGEGIIKKGRIDRKTLRGIVFSDPLKLKLLNRIAHPLILEETKKRIAKSKKDIILDAPLLFEARFDALCDFTIVVHARREVVLGRLLRSRPLTKEEILSIMRSQMPYLEKKMRADFAVDSSGTYESTQRQLRLILRKINAKG